MNNGLQKLRGTGRTTRMLEHAKKLAREGKAVYVIADNTRDARRLQMLCGEENLGIKFETSRSLKNFDWKQMRLIGAHPNCVVLVDHHAIEDHFARVLEMLHAYDELKNDANDDLRMSGASARAIIQNCHAMLRHRFRGVPLWSMVGKITGHGSGNSARICQTANLDPHQPAGSKTLRDYIPNAKSPGHE